MFTEEVIDALRSFNKFEVEYVVVGGIAVVAHGYDRTTGDLDWWVDNSKENIERLTKALLACNFEDNQVSLAMESYEKKGHLTFLLDKRISLNLVLDYSSSISFSEALKKSLESNMFGVKLRVVDLGSLIDIKIRAGREQDLRDVLELKKRIIYCR